jgi:hypothetical protein
VQIHLFVGVDLGRPQQLEQAGGQGGGRGGLAGGRRCGVEVNAVLGVWEFGKT